MVVIKPRMHVGRLTVAFVLLFCLVSCYNIGSTILHRRREPCGARHGRRVATTSAQCRPRQQSL
jgi:hypothetical protein